MAWPYVNTGVDNDGETYTEEEMFNADGAENIVDDVPIDPPIGYVNQPSLYDEIRRMVRSAELAREAEAAGAETFEEADDFDIEDDVDISAAWENEFDPPIRQMAEDGQAEIDRKESEKNAPVTASGDKEPVRQDPKPKKTTSSEQQQEGSEAD